MRQRRQIGQELSRTMRQRQHIGQELPRTMRQRLHIGLELSRINILEVCLRTTATPNALDGVLTNNRHVQCHRTDIEGGELCFAFPRRPRISRTPPSSLARHSPDGHQTRAQCIAGSLDLARAHAAQASRHQGRPTQSSAQDIQPPYQHFPAPSEFKVSSSTAAPQLRRRPKCSRWPQAGAARICAREGSLALRSSLQCLAPLRG